MKISFRSNTAAEATFLLFLGIVFVRLLERLWVHQQIMPGYVFLLYPVAYLVMSTVKRRGAIIPKLGAPESMIVFFLLFFPLLSLVYNLIAGGDYVDSRGRSAHAFSVFVFLYGATFLIIGIILSRTNRTYPVLIYVLFSSTLILVAINSTRGFLDYSVLRGETGIDVLSHLWINESAIIFFILAYSVTRSRVGKLLVACASVAGLVAIGGRSSLFFFMLSLVIFEVLRSRVGAAKLFAIALACALSIGLLLPSTVYEYIDPDMLKRVFFMGGLDSDGSWSDRRVAMQVGVELLDKTLLLGDPAIYASRVGNIGFYIHNVLSGWQFFGLPFFIVICVAFFFCIGKMLRLFRKKELTSNDNFKAMFLVFVSCGFSSTIFIGTSWVWLCLGLWLGSARTSIRASPKTGLVAVRAQASLPEKQVISRA